MSARPKPHGIGRSFASDNNAGAHPEVMKAVLEANRDHVVAYGDDPFTASAEDKFREHFGDDAEVFFVFNGTAANVLAITSMNRPYHAVLCSDVAHINTDECGAPERMTGCKLVSLPTADGKLTVRQLEERLHGLGEVHHVQPHVISVTQATEMGTLYRPEELREICDFAHRHGLWVHMDGARLANAAARLGLSLRAASRDLGVDVLSLGGTKNGLLFGEAVVFFEKRLAEGFGFLRKQGMQLPSKMRFVAAQFDALLSGDLWKRNADHANRMADRLAQKLTSLPGINLARPVEANAVFVKVPRDRIAAMQAESFFYVWDAGKGEVRWMTSFDTTEADIDAFLARMLKCL